MSTKDYSPVLYKTFNKRMLVVKKDWINLNNRVKELEAQLEEVNRKLQDEIITNDQMFSSDDCP